MNTSLTLPPNRIRLLAPSGLKLTTFTLHLRQSGWATTALGVLVAVSMLLTTRVSAAEGEATPPGASGTMAAS